MWFSSRVVKPQIVKRKSGHDGSVGRTQKVMASKDQTCWLSMVSCSALVRWYAM